jgi:NAD(P)-dependent dehydrogenase (short-subunit alcohol dehydrogenase family)
MATAVVTGSASGIGAAVRARFEQAGDTVIGIDIREADIVADLSTPGGREAALAEVGRRCDVIGSFVACAGLATDVRPLSLIPSVNYFGAIALLDGLFDLLRRGTDPSAVLILSNSAQWMRMTDTPYVRALMDNDEAGAARIADETGDAVLAAGGAYVGSKLALGRAMRLRAGAWGRAGVRLNAVAPGNTDTPMLQRVIDDPTTRDGVLGMEIPLGRLARPDEVAALVFFLCTKEASYAHGGVYYVDGGIDATIRPECF